MTTPSRRCRAALVSMGLAAAMTLAAAAPVAQLAPHAHAAMSADDATPLEVSTARPFAELAQSADRRMHQAMAAAPRTGDPDHDFASAMIPHHQGAVDMARIQLLYGKDPVLRRIAQEIIVTQQQEIEVMRRALAAARRASSDPTPKP